MLRTFKWHCTHWRLFVNRLDDELLIVEGNVPDLTPGEADLWGQSEEEKKRPHELYYSRMHKHKLVQTYFTAGNVSVEIHQSCNILAEKISLLLFRVSK